MSRAYGSRVFLEAQRSAALEEQRRRDASFERCQILDAQLDELLEKSYNKASICKNYDKKNFLAESNNTQIPNVQNIHVNISSTSKRNGLSCFSRNAQDASIYDLERMYKYKIGCINTRLKAEEIFDDLKSRNSDLPKEFKIDLRDCHRPKSESLTDLNLWLSRVEDRRKQAINNLHKHKHNELIKGIKSSVNCDSVDEEDDSSQESPEVDSNQKKVNDSYNLILQLEDPNLRRTYNTRVEDCAELDSNEAKTKILEINTEVYKLLKKQRLQTSIDEIIFQIVHIKGPEAENARLFAKKIDNEQQLVELASLADLAKKADKEKTEANYLKKCLAESLKSMGYE
ncbi:MAG: hypothetical protein HUJ63_12970, partial [Enterococcus sp.]|nr:hypothetical protein [Enterococcus sp.]